MTGQTPDDILNDAIVREARWGGRKIPYEAGDVPRLCGPGEDMTIHELLAACDPSEITVQWLHESVTRVTAKKRCTQVTFATNQITPGDLVGDEMKPCIILWIDRSAMERVKHGAAQEVTTLRALLRESILDIMERREYSVCWHDGSDFDGDCGNWPECNPECSLRKLMDAVGIKPQVDGGVDKQHE